MLVFSKFFVGSFLITENPQRWRGLNAVSIYQQEQPTLYPLPHEYSDVHNGTFSHLDQSCHPTKQPTFFKPLFVAGCGGWSTNSLAGLAKLFSICCSKTSLRCERTTLDAPTFLRVIPLWKSERWTRDFLQKMPINIYNPCWSMASWQDQAKSKYVKWPGHSLNLYKTLISNLKISLVSSFDVSLPTPNHRLIRVSCF